MKHLELDHMEVLMQSISELQRTFLPALQTLQPTKWNEYHLMDPRGANELTDKYHKLVGDEAKQVRKLLRTVPEDDLMSFNIMQPTELEARKGLALLMQASEMIYAKHDEVIKRLRVWQGLRDFANVELERRSRANMLASGGGEPLDQFTSRFMFGQPPAPFSVKGSKPQPREWLVARVKSGKNIAIEHLNFNIPSIYDEWLCSELQKEKLWGNAYYYSGMAAPRSVGQKVAALYYKLGFKPGVSVTGSYKIELGWSGSGFRLTHSRNFKTGELHPID